MRYWHMGRSRKARATVAMTAVQLAKSIWKEGKGQEDLMSVSERKLL